MSAAKKRRRRLYVDQRLFLWYTTDDSELLYWQHPQGNHLLYVSLTIVSDDKQFLVKYVIGQSRVPAPYRPYLVVIGPEFPGLTFQGRAQRVQTPCWDDDEPATPKLVRRIIDWGLASDKDVLLLDWRGQSAP